VLASALPCCLLLQWQRLLLLPLQEADEVCQQDDQVLPIVLC
jgi:hypothetical protein